jgi:uncharacterized protein (TIGR02246 family)
MNTWVITAKVALRFLMVLSVAAVGARAQQETARQQIEAWNQKYIAAHLRMDNAAILSMWQEDGVSLLQGMPPIVGKQAIGKFFDDAVAQIAGYHMKTMEVDFREIQLMGDWAYEWGIEHQVLEPPPGKEAFDGRGNILLILHKNAGGEWKIKQEMWSAAPKS